MYSYHSLIDEKIENLKGKRQENMKVGNKT